MRPALGALARAFTWPGLTAFGGPAAHIAIMQREFVEPRRPAGLLLLGSSRRSVCSSPGPLVGLLANLPGS